MDACTNPDILRVIYFFLLILDVVKIIIPIALIVLGLIDMSKSVMSNDESAQSKKLKLFFKRILYAVLIFAVPWIVEVFIVTLGDLIGEDKVNFTDCLDNANSECIEALEEYDLDNSLQYCDIQKQCWYCSNEKKYYWGYFSPLSENKKCPGSVDGEWFMDKTKTESDCQ